MNALARLVDRLRHPEVRPAQREYREWVAYLGRVAPAPPYVLTSARVTTEVSQVPVRFNHDEPEPLRTQDGRLIHGELTDTETAAP